MDLSDRMAPSKKCSRCRAQRKQETERELSKFSTCKNCRLKRRVVKTLPPPDEAKKLGSSTGTCYYFNDFLDIIKTNVIADLSDVKYSGMINTEIIPVYTATQIEEQHDQKGFYSEIVKKLISLYLEPIMSLTNYTLRIRDYHKGGSKTKKISLTFICAQDRTHQRKSRSKNLKHFSNKLKIFECYSKVLVKYDLLIGRIDISYSHLHHSFPSAYSIDSQTSDVSSAHSSTEQYPSNSVESIAVAASASTVSNKYINIDDRLVHTDRPNDSYSDRFLPY